MNISEFAAIAGVSKAAVSRYFNNGYLSDEKRELIEKAIEKTGYAPSVQAQNVRTKVTKLVGVIIPKLSSESCSRVVEGISGVLSEHGYQILLADTENDYEKEIEFLDLFRHNRVDGVIFLASVFTERHEAILKKMRVPVVIVGQEYDGYNCVCHDDFGVAYALTKLMLQKGRQHPAFIGVFEEDRAVGLMRKQGFLKAVSETSAVVAKNHMTTAKFTMESGYEKMAALLNSDCRPDCVFCVTDTIAAGALLCCRENGVKVPDDIMIASVGDSKLCKITPVPLTSAHLYYKTSGAEAAEMLLVSLKHSSRVPKVLRLAHEIAERDSTGYETV